MSRALAGGLGNAGISGTPPGMQATLPGGGAIPKRATPSVPAKLLIFDRARRDPCHGPCRSAGCRLQDSNLSEPGGRAGAPGSILGRGRMPRPGFEPQRARRASGGPGSILGGVGCPDQDSNLSEPGGRVVAQGRSWEGVGCPDQDSNLSEPGGRVVAQGRSWEGSDAPTRIRTWGRSSGGSRSIQLSYRGSPETTAFQSRFLRICVDHVRPVTHFGSPRPEILLDQSKPPNWRRRARVSTGDGQLGHDRKDGQLTVQVEQAGDALLVWASGELTRSTAERFEAELRQAIDNDASAVVLDLGAVGFIDSAGLRSVLRIANHSFRDGGRLRMRIHRRLSEKRSRGAAWSGSSRWSTEATSYRTPR